ncbi:cytochrome c [Altericroceibacterium xinjiangense]|uniref:cytochrome c n=1 Tax=Altericroceibacterium xinjiangense TaxID=762261 RepID=UPI000F7E51D2|nr:cytochrome c [Altericroceibacterium xinjiangense]
MKWRGFLVVSALVLAGCSSRMEPAPEVEQPTLYQVMKDEIDPKADEIWAIGNAAIGDQAGLDPNLMTDESWSALALHATDLQQAALKLASLDPIVVARPGVTILDEGVPGGHSAAQVQQQINDNPQLMRDMSRALAAHAGGIAAAARAQDAATAGPLIDQLDSVCESCHLEFWYPSQKALVEQIENEIR